MQKVPQVRFPWGDAPAAQVFAFRKVKEIQTPARKFCRFAGAFFVVRLHLNCSQKILLYSNSSCDMIKVSELM
ncbi:MAG: hypothetical protein J6K73_09250 [Clostridia bacterium]|nr:hypothetical protein [Clostridia bacterium]